jgi:glycosyltransferase involved in cell wall biosynthesis
MRESLSARAVPKVSVVVPCRDEAARILECIASLAEDGYQRNRLEILVVDGGSNDGTRQIVERMARTYRCIELLENGRRTTTEGLNIGIQAATGEVIMIASAHARYEVGYISRSVEVLRASGADCVGGRMETVPGEATVVADAIALALSSRFGVGNSRFRTSPEPGYVDTVAFGVYRRDVFDRVGPFDERLIRNQDIEFNARLRRAGGRILLVPGIRSFYYCRTGLRALWSQNFRNGQWNMYTVALTGGSLSWRHFVPLVFASGLVASAALAAWSAVFGWAFLAIWAAYFCSATVAALVSPEGQRRASRWILPFVFVVLHVGYGLGSLWGIVTMPLVLRRELR